MEAVGKKEVGLRAKVEGVVHGRVVDGGCAVIRWVGGEVGWCGVDGTP